MNVQKKFTRYILAFCLIALVLCPAALAKEVEYSKKLVNGNDYTYVTQATKETRSSTAAVHITNIDKADGYDSLYSYLWVKATSDGTGTQIVKGSSYDVAIPSSYQAKGSIVEMYAKGNIPFLDCTITGYWNVH